MKNKPCASFDERRTSRRRKKTYFFHCKTFVKEKNDTSVAPQHKEFNDEFTEDGFKLLKFLERFKILMKALLVEHGKRVIIHKPPEKSTRLKWTTFFPKDTMISKDK